MNQEKDRIDYVQICVCANLRKTTRVITQLYDKLFQSTGLKVTQYSMLVAISRNEEISISELGEMMILEQSTVTRNVNNLKSKSFVTVTKARHDARTKIISITDLGIEKLREASPIWLQIQKKIVHNIGEEKYKDLLETLAILQKSFDLLED